MHAESHRSGLEDGTEKIAVTVTNHKELNVELTEEHDPEPPVVEWTKEDVELACSILAMLLSAGIVNDIALLGGLNDDGHLIEHAAVDHIEHVHHHEYLEHKSLVKQAV
jgi:hypothetical protein